ncbi:MAG: hypothetical protein GX267_02780 [Fibrobacter sp.]|jgi:hypothetical protein|nr:hypothetical protein [Fibrobacter sp.]
MKKALIIISILVLAAGGGLVYYFFFSKNLSDQIVLPYIAHQKPRVDPHVPSAVPVADKLDEVLFDGLFNISANRSGTVYEDGLGEFVSIDQKNNVTIRLKPRKKWHNSYSVTMDKKNISISEKEGINFTAKDLKFTLNRIKKLGSISPDYILVSQAVPSFDFQGPNDDGEIVFQLKSDRIWTESDIKEVFSFKILPFDSELDAPFYNNGTGPYLQAGEIEDKIHFHKSPDYNAVVNNVVLKPYIDNSTYSTELKNRNINVLLSTPFGAISPILGKTEKYFYKSSISTCFFALFFNVERLDLDQRKALRKMIDNKKILNRFFRIGTEQQRHIANYRGENNNYEEYLNYSVFPTTSYYVEDSVVIPATELDGPDPSVLPDTVQIQTCLTHDYREELAELVEILNDPSLFGGKIKVNVVPNAEIRKGNYDAVLVAVSGYRSNFLFDMYNIFLRQPDFETYRVNLHTAIDKKGKQVILDQSFEADKNFFRIDLGTDSPERGQFTELLKKIYGFMATHEIGDKQYFARDIDQLEHELALGSWLFSLPSLAYFSTQFDSNTIDLYGTASQLSTIEKWQEARKK